MEEVVNRVAKSGLLVVDLEEYLHRGAIVIFDLKDVLHEGMILKEKEFRNFIFENDWTAYSGKNVGLICSAEAVVPVWAYMLLAVSLQNVTNSVTFGDREEVEKELINQAIEKYLLDHVVDGRKVMIKGCGNIRHREYAHTQLTKKLMPTVSSLMYGEPCGAVPLYKKKSSQALHSKEATTGRPQAEV